MFDETELSQLREVVSDAIYGGRLGVAQFLRCHAVTDDPGLLDASLSALTSLGDAWFGSGPAQAHRLGEDSGIYLTEMLKWDARTVITEKQRQEHLYYTKCFLCGRTLHQIQSEGCNEPECPESRNTTAVTP